MEFNKSKRRRGEKLEFGPQPLQKAPQKFLTTKVLVVRGILFIASVAGACYLLWQEFSGR
jgi:hypothetical protein